MPDHPLESVRQRARAEAAMSRTGPPSLTTVS
jgi:hypothetical protein